ncbi:hypothetical protein NHX12_005389 [Muraenolepis orangiensis]|uniref:Myosin tail domain-containing protein n=1 Tax=Muraenolepis orangiensis TaxID=630683 RepID=A0A9Q0IDN3_9TELE|nr:hypothetical protein NHX12_005389 [Muraenolepis orangiensis]
MESYRGTGIQQGGLQQAYTQPSRTNRAPNNGAGTYGLSIRVQGIDGHPYVVLNNQDRGGYPNGNGYGEAEESFIDNYQEYDFRGGKDGGSSSSFKDYRSKTQMYHNDPQQHADSQGKKPSTLLNFQKHPEILQPYNPDNGALALHASSHPARPHSLAGTRAQQEGPSAKSTLPAGPHVGSSSLNRDGSPAHQMKTPLSSKTQTEAVQTQTKPAEPKSISPPQTAPSYSRPRAQVTPPHSKPPGSSQSTSFPNPQALGQPSQPPHRTTSTGTGSVHEQDKSSRRSSRTISSANSTLERNHPEPDVLPLRRTDSSGPVLQSLSRSRHSSLSSTTTSARSLVDEQLDALYPDTINRHQNRRYIPFLAGSGRDIDTGSIPAVDDLIDKFDGKDGSHQRRGRTGRRNRLNAEDRKRSRSVDSALPFASREGSGYMDEFGKQLGTSMEHVLRPSQLRLQKTAGSQDSWVSVVDGKSSSRPSSCGISAPTSPQYNVSKGVGSIQGYTKPQSRSSTALALKSNENVEGSSSPGKTSLNATMPSSKPSSCTDRKPGMEADVKVVTPDLLKGQQEISQQTHEETAKLILYNYLKDGSSDNDDTTKRKVNLVFEKIQTLKSRATGGIQVDNNQQSVDLAAQTQALQDQKEKLEKEIFDTKQQLEEQSMKSRLDLEKFGTGLKELQQRENECSRLKNKLEKTEADLQTTLEELFQVKMEREQYQSEIRDLQDQLSEMHDELDTAKKSAAADGEKDAIMTDLMQLRAELQELLLAREELEEMLRRRERELTALKGALKEEVATHDQEVDKLREQYDREISVLQTSLEEAKQSNAAVLREKAQLEAAKGAAEDQAGSMNQEAERSSTRARELEDQVAKLHRVVDEARLQENRLGDRVVRLERDKKHLEESLAEVKEQEEEMSHANRALTTRLEEVQRHLSKLSLEHRDLEERLKEEKIQKEQFKIIKNEIEDERRLLDRTVEKLQREMNDIVDASQCSTLELQEQIDIYKEKNRRELAELQRELKDRGLELERSQTAARSLQDELSRRVEDLQQCQREWDEAVEKRSALERTINDLETVNQTNAHTKDEKARHFKLLEERIVQLELDLGEEHQSGDQLMNRIDRGRDQVEQMRSELLQERSSRQDLECDKMALERQNKDLKSRVSHLEGSQKSNQEGLVSQLESRVGELEERLEAEERERANLQLVNRRLERKVKEMMLHGDEEHLSMQDQRDQLNLRLKALKRQMDEAEEEIDRLEHGKKKLQRELDEQQEDAAETVANGDWKKKNGLVHRGRPVGREAPDEHLRTTANGGALTESSVQQHGSKVYGVVQRTGSDRQQEVMARGWSVNHLQDEMKYIKEVRDSLEKVRERMYGQFGGMQQSVQKLSQEIRTANSQRRSLESEVRVRTAAMDSFDQMNSSLISTNIDLQKSMLENCQTRMDMREEVKTLRSTCTKTEEKLREKERRLASVEVESTQEARSLVVQEVTSRLQREYEERLMEEQKKHREEIETLQAQIDVYIRRLEETEAKVRTAEAQIAERDQRIGELERLLDCMGQYSRYLMSSPTTPQDTTTSTTAQLSEPESPTGDAGTSTESEKLLSNRRFLKSLPDGGRKISDFAERMDTSHTGHPRVTDEAQETADAGLSVDSNVTLESDLVQALGKVTLSDTSSGRDSKGASLNSNADTDNVFLRKQPPLKPHYLEIFERNEGISDHRKQRFKPNQLPSRVDPHSSSESLPTGDSPRRASPLSAQARKEMDRKHLDDITAARQAPLRHDPAQLLSLKESAELLREQSRKHQEIQSRVAAQKLSEALKVSMGSFIADTGPMAAYREVQDDPAQLSSEED